MIPIETVSYCVCGAADASHSSSRKTEMEIDAGSRLKCPLAHANNTWLSTMHLLTASAVVAVGEGVLA